MPHQAVQYLSRIGRFSRDIGHVAAHRKQKSEGLAPVGGHGLREVDGGVVSLGGEEGEDVQEEG